MDVLVERLHRSVRDLRLRVPGPLRDTAVLDEIDDALAPACLPASVRRLWELVDADALRRSVAPYPELATPSFSLHGRRTLDEPEDFVLSHPRHFFQLCYESHGEMSVECDGPTWTGGCLFDWFISDPASPFVLRFRSVEDWLETILACLDERAYQWFDAPVVVIDHRRFRQLAEERLAAHPHPDYGASIEISRDRDEWPEVWRSREDALK